jgi:hypothetical protein
MDFQIKPQTALEGYCNSHQDNKITLYCICGSKLCKSCLDIHFHENLAFFDSQKLKNILAQELPLMYEMIKEVDDILWNSSLDRDRLNIFKEIKTTVELFKDEKAQLPEKIVEYIKENYRSKLESLLIHSLFNVNLDQKKLNKIILEQESKEKRLERKMKIKKIDRKRLLKSELQSFAPSPKKEPLSSNRLSSAKNSRLSSVYGSSRCNKTKKIDNLVVSNFSIQLEKIQDDSYKSEDSLEDICNIPTRMNAQQITYDEVPLKSIKKENDIERKLSICDNCNCYFILTKDHVVNLCSKCRKTELSFKEKVKLVCVNCRDTFSVEKSDECMLRTKCDICNYNSKLN